MTKTGAWHAPTICCWHDIRTVQKLLGHKSVETTTMIYSHVAGGTGAWSPLDYLLG